jgi:hypothetical protein
MFGNLIPTEEQILHSIVYERIEYGNPPKVEDLTLDQRVIYELGRRKGIIEGYDETKKRINKNIQMTLFGHVI